MNPSRRRLIGALALAACGRAAADGDAPPRPGRALVFPRDHGAHPARRIEWWYATGWLAAPGVVPATAAAAQLSGFQLTFFRSRTGLGEALPGRLAPRQLLFAHAAVSDLRAGKHRHAQRIERWAGDEDRAAVHALRVDTALAIGDWTLRRDGPRYLARLAAPAAGFALDLSLATTQPLLLQGDAGWSRKGPLPDQASCYYSQPQLAAAGKLRIDRNDRQLAGRGWLDHEWSDELLAADAVGWDWIGINLFDGGALTAFRLRRADDGVVWAGGSWRAAGGAVRAFAPDQVRFEAGEVWTSPASGARYPVRWRMATPAGTFEVAALLDAQELDSRASTGAIYWEGLVELRDGAGQRIGLGYLEMTGRAAPLALR